MPFRSFASALVYGSIVAHVPLRWIVKDGERRAPYTHAHGLGRMAPASPAGLRKGPCAADNTRGSRAPRLSGIALWL